MSSTLQILHGIEPIYDEWRNLWKDVSAGPFLHPGWHEAYLESSPAGTRPEILVVHTGDRLDAVLPLRRDTEGALKYLTAPRSDYDDALIRSGSEFAALDLLSGYLIADRFDLAEVPADSALIASLSERGARTAPAAYCPGIALDENSIADVSNRTSVKRHEKKLAKLGPVVLRPVPAEESSDRLEEMIDQHIARWLASGSESLFFDESNVSFYEKLIGHPHFREFGSFDVLECGDRQAAFHLGLHGAETFIWYKPSFDLNLMSHGPGEVLMKYLIQSAFASGATYFDFTRGNEGFKNRFANAKTRNVRIYHRRPILPRAKAFVLGKGKRVRKILGSTKRRLTPNRHRSQCFFELAPPSILPDLPSPFDHQVGPIDLVAFGAQSRFNPSYVSKDRMRSAVERAKRGDLLLTIRLKETGQIVHFSWLRVDEKGVQGDFALCPLPDANPAGVIFDCWTSPDCRGQGLYPWAIRRLAAEAHSKGLRPWI
ncbi:MAG: GNAT family N-acetyltransferase, partial [Verrucomicrobiae bacterium]|nr:GNAT family N-acetyltransferase [Verrucomicrobiae bacterium]